MFTAFPLVAVFFSAHPVGKWLKSKVFMLLGLGLLVLMMLAGYAVLVSKIKAEAKMAQQLEVQARALKALSGEVRLLKASAASSEAVLLALEREQLALTKKFSTRNTAVATRVQAIAASDASPLLKAQSTSAVYATSLQDAYCAASSESCSSSLIMK